MLVFDTFLDCNPCNYSLVVVLKCTGFEWNIKYWFIHIKTQKWFYFINVCGLGINPKEEHTNTSMFTSYDVITLLSRTDASRLAVYDVVWITARYITVMSKVSWSTPWVRKQNSYTCNNLDNQTHSEIVKNYRKKSKVLSFSLFHTYTTKN